MKSLLTTTEVAARLNCSRETVRALCDAGKLPATRLNDRGHWRVQEDDLDRFLAVNYRSGSITQDNEPRTTRAKRTVTSTPELDRLMGKRK